MTDSFTSELWQSVAGIYEAILAHPFLAGLADGSLPEETFAFYVVQDGLYLKQYGHTLAAIASRAPDASDTEMFARHFIGVVAVDRLPAWPLRLSRASTSRCPGAGWRPGPAAPATRPGARARVLLRQSARSCRCCNAIYWPRSAARAAPRLYRDPAAPQGIASALQYWARRPRAGTLRQVRSPRPRQPRRGRRGRAGPGARAGAGRFRETSGPYRAV